jgi:sugar phosphate isomerase/epimerase
VWPGNGLIPLREWVDAIRSTGFDGWWSCELLGPLFWEMEPGELARAARTELTEMLAPTS